MSFVALRGINDKLTVAYRGGFIVDATCKKYIPYTYRHPKILIRNSGGV
jgi:hypothetical protein